MDSLLRRKLSWAAIAVLSVPALGLFGYSLRHPGVRGRDDRLFPVAAQAAAANPASPWVMQDSGTTAGLRGIYSVDGKIAWASGTGGTVLRTVDGGEHWAKCAVPDGDKDGATLDFRGVQAWDAKTAIVMASGPGEKSRLYKTTDGCGNWALLFRNPNAPEGFFDSFAISGERGMLLGDPVKGRMTVFRSSDSGVSWKLDQFKGLELDGKSVAAFAASNSCIVRDGSFFLHGFVTGGKDGSFYYRRAEDEANGVARKKTPWTFAPIPIANGNDSSGAFSVFYRYPVTNSICQDCAIADNATFIAVGGDYAIPGKSAGTAARSTDGGQHWTGSTSPPHGYRSSVAWSEERKAWIAAGTNGSDISRDDGKTWEPLDDENWNALSLPFVVGPKGRIGRLAK